MSDKFTYSGEGQALVVREKCNELKSFTSSYTYACGNDECNLSILNYQNSFIGKIVANPVLLAILIVFIFIIIVLPIIL